MKAAIGQAEVHASLVRSSASPGWHVGLSISSSALYFGANVAGLDAWLRISRRSSSAEVTA